MKFAKTMLLSSALFANLSLFADQLPEPYLSVNQLAATPYYFDNTYPLLDLISTMQAQVFVDVGSGSGAVSRLIAQNTTGVQIYNVSMWQSCDSSNKFGFQRFLSNVILEGTTAKITPLRMSSLEAAKAINFRADIVYLDSTEQILSSEILAWASHLTQNGTICGHDWTEPSVQFSVAQAANKLGLLVKSNGDFWYLQKN